MIVSLNDTARMFNVSTSKILNVKRKLGYPKGYKTTDKDVADIREELQNTVRTGGHTNDNFPEYYEQVLGIIENQGYIEYRELITIFRVASISHVEAYFESQGNPIYDETEKIKVLVHRKSGSRMEYRRRKTYRLLRPLFSQWRQEAKHNNGQKNGRVETNQSNRYRVAG